MSGYDSTAGAALGELSGESLLAEVFARVPGKRDRALLLANVGLGISLASLERQFRVDRRELAARLEAILEILRGDEELSEALSGIHRAGRGDNYQAMVIRLGLEDWFCRYCGNFMVQPVTGRRRKTCSDRCRHQLWQAEQDDPNYAIRRRQRILAGSRKQRLFADYLNGVRVGRGHKGRDGIAAGAGQEASPSSPSDGATGTVGGPGVSGVVR